jgi:hypothetical protein
MDTQQAYEQIREYFAHPSAVLAKQDGGTSCAYRTDVGGHACAVGCIIPDEVYDERMEGTSFCPNWLGRWQYLAGLLHNVDKDFLRRAQVLHDVVAADAKAFVTGLDVLAAASGLVVSNNSFVTSYAASNDC